MHANGFQYETGRVFRQFHIIALIALVSIAWEAQAQEIRRAVPVTPPSSSDTEANPSSAIPPRSSQDPSSPDEQAKFLAGIDLPNGSRLGALQSTPAYRDHMRQFSKTWSNFNTTHFNKMRAWSQSELAPKLPSASVLLYMFGGPDFINAFALFPNMPIMVLCGLEPIGNVVAPEQLDDTRLASVLTALRTTTDSTLKWSFFIRKDMKVDFQRSDFQGVLPVLYTFLALSGNSIEQTTFLRAGGFPAVCITYRQGPSSPKQTLYYISGNLANGSTGSLFSWASSLGSSIGYLKAASYLMHQDGFSSVRNFLLSRCSAILQDDSGIPYRYFSPNQWQISLYGKYTTPIELFKMRYQDDLRAAYETSGTVDFLPFGTGYRWRPGESNLMLAIRKTAGAIAVPPADTFSHVPNTN